MMTVVPRHHIVYTYIESSKTIEYNQQRVGGTKHRRARSPTASGRVAGLITAGNLSD